MTETLTGQQVLDADLADWRLLVRALHAHFATGDFATGLQLAERIGAAAEELNHHPDIDLRYPHVTVRLTSHDSGGVTQRDVELARRISAAAADLGVPAEPARVSVWELALDAADHDAIKPFWRALLGYRQHPSDDNEINDPGAAAPTMWFQGTEPHEEPRQRFHLDVWVPHDVAEQRITDALAAGGTMVSDAEAPSFWVLADADGNKACICTWQERD
ncbi:MAG: 4a-hydroxytetrahydrobiopterin dehydratase [Nocardioides sp.]